MREMTMKRNNFSRGAGKTVFTCDCCGRQTRITHQPTDCTSCFECWELAGWQNSVWDGTPLEEVVTARDDLLATIVARGGDEAAVRGEFSELFPT
jgi:hypothetical protein